MKAYFDASRNESMEIIKIMDAENYVDAVYQKNLEKWKSNGEKENKPKPKTHPTNNMQLPETLHNGMISNVVPYKIRGAIWYQDESNAVFMTNEYYLIAMINSWCSE